MSADEQLGLAYVPVEAPTGDVYGGHRPGANLFSDSLVALDLKTGRRVWHYQLIHHDIWDRDIPSPPVLADITVNGRRIKAVIQPTKQAFTYVFDRATGQPVWPIEESPVPTGDVPGEWYSPTQPFPAKPPAFDRQGITTNDLINFTPELRKQAEDLVSRYKVGPLFTPPVVSQWDGPRGTLTVPETGGGANWQGGSFDPETSTFYVYSVTALSSFGVVKSDGSRSDMDYIMGVAKPPQTADAGAARAGDNGGLTVQGLPLLAPPWGRITAIDMNAGDIRWQIAHGETPDAVRNHPALRGLSIPRTGRIGRIGTLVTRSLLVAGEGGFATTPSGARGAMLRAYDKGTGAELGAVYMPAPQTGSPMTYMLGGRQYIVVAVSGANYGGELLAFALP
jgi:quinoprotein glucose dehydrogenase